METAAANYVTAHTGQATRPMAPYDAQDASEKVRLEERYKPSLDLLSTFDQDAFARAAAKRNPPGGTSETFPFFSGWLWKRYQDGGGVVNWKRRWFYLMDDRLCYTRTGDEIDETCVVRYVPLDRVAMRAKWLPNGNAPTAGIRSVPRKTAPPGLRLAGAGSGTDRCFQIQCGAVTHVLAADTDALAARWLERINDAWTRCVSSSSRRALVATESERLMHECARLRGELSHANDTLSRLRRERTGTAVS